VVFVESIPPAPPHRWEQPIRQGHTAGPEAGVRELAAGPLPRSDLVQRLAAPTRDLPAVAHSTVHQVAERMAERGWVTQTRVPREGKAGRPTVEVDEGRRVLGDLPVPAGVA
jgi:hypothetical protein